MRTKVYSNTVTVPEDAITIVGKIPTHAMGSILRSQVNRYANPYIASLREYLTNAIDSHIVSGQTKPVEVTLPTAMSPEMSIRDFGEGMSGDDIVNIYANVRVTTKDKSDLEHGGLGIGSKSGLAYCTQFTGTAVKNGKRTTFIMSLVENELNTHILEMDVDAPDEESGFEVRLALNPSDVYRFSEKDVMSVLTGFTSDEVKVMNPSSDLKKLDRIADSWLEFEHGYVDVKGTNRSTGILVGKVWYPYNHYNNKVVPKMDISEITVNESRESIEMTNDNSTAISNKIELLNKEINNVVERVLKGEKVEGLSEKDAAFIYHQNMRNKWSYKHFDELSPKGFFVGLSCTRKVDMIDYVSSSYVYNGVFIEGVENNDEAYNVIRSIRTNKMSEFSADSKYNDLLDHLKVQPDNKNKFLVITRSNDEFFKHITKYHLTAEDWAEFKGMYEDDLDAAKKRRKEEAKKNPSAKKPYVRKSVEDLEVKVHDCSSVRTTTLSDMKGRENIVFVKSNNNTDQNYSYKKFEGINFVMLNSRIMNSHKRMEEIREYFNLNELKPLDSVYDKIDDLNRMSNDYKINQMKKFDDHEEIESIIAEYLIGDKFGYRTNLSLANFKSMFNHVGIDLLKSRSATFAYSKWEKDIRKSFPDDVEISDRIYLARYSYSPSEIDLIANIIVDDIHDFYELVKDCAEKAFPLYNRNHREEALKAS